MIDGVATPDEIERRITKAQFRSVRLYQPHLAWSARRVQMRQRQVHSHHLCFAAQQARDHVRRDTYPAADVEHAGVLFQTERRKYAAQLGRDESREPLQFAGIRAVRRVPKWSRKSHVVE